MDHVQEFSVSASSSASSNTPSNAPYASSPISIAKVLASTPDTASRAPHPTRHCSGSSVDLTVQLDTPSSLLVYSRSCPVWGSLPLIPHSCTRSWYVLSSRRTTGRQYSFLGSWAASSFVPKLPKIPEEESDNESLDIGLERQVHFKNNATVYSYDSIRDQSIDVKNKLCHRELK